MRLHGADFRDPRPTGDLPKSALEAVAAIGVSDADGLRFSVQLTAKDGVPVGTLSGQVVLKRVPSLAEKVKSLQDARRSLRRVRCRQSRAPSAALSHGDVALVSRLPFGKRATTPTSLRI